MAMRENSLFRIPTLRFRGVVFPGTSASQADALVEYGKRRHRARLGARGRVTKSRSSCVRAHKDDPRGRSRFLGPADRDISLARSLAHLIMNSTCLDLDKVSVNYSRHHRRHVNRKTINNDNELASISYRSNRATSIARLFWNKNRNRRISLFPLFHSPVNARIRKTSSGWGALATIFASFADTRRDKERERERKRDAERSRCRTHDISASPSSCRRESSSWWNSSPPFSLFDRIRSRRKRALHSRRCTFAIDLSTITALLVYFTRYFFFQTPNSVFASERVTRWISDHLIVECLRDIVILVLQSTASFDFGLVGLITRTRESKIYSSIHVLQRES